MLTIKITLTIALGPVENRSKYTNRPVLSDKMLKYWLFTGYSGHYEMGEFGRGPLVVRCHHSFKISPAHNKDTYMLYKKFVRFNVYMMYVFVHFEHFTLYNIYGARVIFFHQITLFLLINLNWFMFDEKIYCGSELA